MQQVLISPHPGIDKIRAHMIVEDVDDHTEVRIDISSNESAYGPSPSVISAAISATGKMHRYAANAAPLLARRIASHYNLDPDGVVCGHGSDDLLLRTSQAFLQNDDELICSVHGYQRIPNFAYTANAIPVKAKDNNFRADITAIMDCVTDRTKVVMIANPDNPTGTCLSGKEIRTLRDNLPSQVLLVLDSAYLEYADNTEFENPAVLVESHRNVIMTRTFSKIFGLAGIRLGWLYSSPEIASAVRKIGMTFPLSNVAFDAGVAALEDQDHPKYVYKQNAMVRQKFCTSLKSLGLDVLQSQTNFVLVRFPKSGLHARKVFLMLRAKGILARQLAAPAFSNYVRFTLGLPEEMEETAASLKQVLNHRN